MSNVQAARVACEPSEPSSIRCGPGGGLGRDVEVLAGTVEDVVAARASVVVTQDSPG
ncbi:MAG: hypothetical protein ACLPQS_04420 [Acidimicrobiales bacterium]